MTTDCCSIDNKRIYPQCGDNSVEIFWKPMEIMLRGNALVADEARVKLRPHTKQASKWTAGARNKPAELMYIKAKGLWQTLNGLVR
jgi:hypothetical protein